MSLVQRLVVRLPNDGVDEIKQLSKSFCPLWDFSVKSNICDQGEYLPKYTWKAFQV
jgi:hypothetical protein